MDSTPCNLTDICSCVTDVDQYIVDGVCHLQHTDSDSDGCVVHQRHPVSSSCLCPIFLDHSCFPTHLEHSNREVVYRTTPPDRETLQSLISSLRENADSVTVRRLVMDVPEDSESSNKLIDTSVLTDLEKQTIERATIAGYYDRPRAMSFEEFAEEFDVSKSTLSRRLASAESKLVGELFDRRHERIEVDG